MRKLSAAAVTAILAIALYFTLLWGYDALRMLTSPTYGLGEVWRSQFVFEIGRLFALSPLGLVKLAAFFAVLKLAVAGICALHIAERFRYLAGGKAGTEIFEVGMMLAMLICIASLVPAIWLHNIELVREQIVQLVLAAVAASLGMLERSYGRETVAVTRVAAAPAMATSGPAYTPFR